MAIKSDDFDLHKTWLRTTLGGNGDYYIEIVSENDKGLKESKSVRISTSGGYTKNSEIKIAISNLYLAMEKAGLNGFIED